MIRIPSAITALILWIAAAAAGQGITCKSVAVPRTSAHIAIDGRLDEPAWKSAAVIPSFVGTSSGKQPGNRTQVRLLFDDRALYIAYECAEKDMARVKAAMKEHDACIWNDDCAEVFLDTKTDRSGFMQFILNTIGARYDGLGNDSYGFNPRWEGKAAAGKAGWTAEIRLPFTELAVPTPRIGDSWLGNFCREEKPSAELSSWSPTNGSFSSTATFGEIIFGSFTDKASRDLAATARSISESERSARDASVNVSGIIAQSRAKLELARMLLSSAHSASESDYHHVETLIAEGQTLLSKVGDMIHRARMGNPEYIVWQTTPWHHFTMNEDTSKVESETKSVAVQVLSGQTESKALMITNLTSETLSARLSSTGFPADSIEILIPAFVRTKGGAAYPDALVPLDPAGQITVPPDETRQIWVNIKGTKSGKYEGALTISPLTVSKTDKQIKFDVEVVQPPVSIPGAQSFTWDYLGDAEEHGLVDQYMQTMVDHGLTVFWISGLRYVPRPKADDAGNLLEPMDWSSFDQQVKLKWRSGRTLYISCDVWEKAAERPIFNGKFDTPGWRIAFKKVTTEMVGELNKLGLSYGDYMVNPLDESIDTRYVAIARLIKEADPKIRVVEDTVGESLDQVKEAAKYTDCWIPHFRTYFADSAKPSIAYMKSTGKPVGFYFYSEGAEEKARDSYHDYLWDFWFAYSQGLDGVFGYWTATQGYGDPWNRHQSAAVYDPSLFYNGNGRTISGRRWEAWRRGIEDYELLKTCAAAGVDKSIITALVKSVLDSPSDPDAAEHARQQLIAALKR